ncbi:protein PHTF2-like [Mytilus californianus]|uniref:protein PHTF2-like n=1 Tax=Mytilus californianus TaxID=6549 RepID=UPI002247F4BC|nr:protein PHTF2-like [Mytilus californianus]
MDQIHDSVAWYQKKIGLHDKQLWEQSVDRKVLRGIRNAPRRSVRAKTEFIDVDLIRGSTFTRAKPQVSWTYIAHKAISRVLFFPFHYKWWLQQTSKRFFAFLLILYTLQLLTTVVFCQNVGAKLAQDELTLSEVFFPIVLMLLLGYIHSTTVVSQSHVSHRSQRDIKSIREYQIRRKRNLSSSSPNHSCEKPSRNSSTLLQDVDRKSPPSVDRRPKRVVKNKEFVVNPKKNGGIESKSVSWSDAYQEEALRIVPDDRIKKQESQDSEITTDEENNGSLKRAESFDSEIDKNINDSKKEITSDNLENLNLSLSGKPEENSGNCKNDDNKKEKCQLKLKLSQGGFPHQENGATKHKHNNCHSNTGVDLLTSDMHLAEKCENNIIEGLKIPNFTDGTILKVENLTAEEAVEFMNPSIDSLSSITSSSSAPESNTLEYEGTSDLDNLAVGGSGVVDYKQTDKLQAKDNKPGSSSYRNPREQLNIIRHGENLSEDSGIDFTNKTLLFRSESVPLPSLHSKPKKEVMSDTDQERNNSGSESDKETQLKAKTALLQGLRRRSHTVGDESSESGPFYRTKRTIARNKESLKKDLSSSDGETSQASHTSGHKLTSSDWEDRVQSDDTTSTYSSSCGSDVELGNEAGQETSTTVLNSSSANQTAGENNIHVINLLQPPTSSSTLGHHYVPPDKVSCVIWEKGECQKVDLTALELGWTIIEKVDDIPESSDYILIGFTFSVLLCLVPLVFRLYHVKEFPSLMSLEIISFLSKVWCCLMHNSWRLNLIMMNGIIQRFWLSSVFFFLLSVADRTFKQRLLYAKHFCYLTSSRRAKKFDMPHFRLNKVRNIKTWLSIRSYLKKRGPQRSVDVIVSASFLITIVLITLMCLQLLKDADTYLDFLCNWELLFWSMTLGVYLFRFLTLGLKINKKYRNLSVLITEQINLYLQMEQKPHKKEELMVANNVLKLAEDLLKELESPFKVSGITANPVIYNITRVVVLSAFSAVLTELLGFKLKLYKIKLKA